MDSWTDDKATMTHRDTEKHLSRYSASRPKSNAITPREIP